MALITEAPATLTGTITGLFSSVPQLAETSRTNITVEFDAARVFATYTNEADQIAALSTQKDYCVFMGPVVNDDEEYVLKVSFLGATYTCELAVASAALGLEITFSKDA